MSVSERFRTMDWGPAPESSAPAIEWIESHGREFGLFIGGRWVPPAEGRYFETLNPSNGRPLASVAQAGQADVDAAVAAASNALESWRDIGCRGRARHLYAIARHLQKQSRFFAVLETLDNGKPIRETRDIDIPLAARHFHYHAGWAQLMETELAGYEPVGVCGQIIPWNFPLLMLAWKIAPALAMGNTVVLKPAEFTPLTALAFAELCAKVGLPDGVVNIVTGDGEAGEMIVAHSGVQKIAFTGSTEVGRKIRAATAGSGKKLSLELGGKSPFIVFDDADLDGAVEGLVDAIWFNQGQVCCAGSRLLVQESIAQRFLAKVRARMEKLRVGDPLDKAIDLGAIIASVQLQRIADLVGKACEEGAELFQPSWACPAEGWFYPPTLITNVEPASTVSQVEIFGPVLVAMTFRTPAEAVDLANNTVYGLAAGVWTENIGLAHDVADRLKAGTVWINCSNRFDASSGFGGYRESGYGREGGREGLYEYVRRPAQVRTFPRGEGRAPHRDPIDRTHKMWIGGRQVRPDGGLSIEIDGRTFGRGNRKDIRDAVEAASAAQKGWAAASAGLRSQILFYLAENLEAARGQVGSAVSDEEFEATVEAVLTFGSWADKFDGQVHQASFQGIVYTRNEPLGTIGIVCGDEAPLAEMAAAVAAAIAMGNAVVVIPAQANPLPAVELCRVIEASDVPGGVVNVVTGLRQEVVPALAGHDGVDAIWCFTADQVLDVEKLSCGNLKQTWATGAMDWFPHALLRHATQVKNIWTPTGD